MINASLDTILPMRLINGAADPNSGWHMVKAFKQLKPDALVIKLEGIGHWPQIEQASRVVATLKSL